jgi:hypothetical protein
LSTLQAVSSIAGATGVFIAAVFYILNLRISQRNQELNLKSQQLNLETRQAQLFMNIYSFWYSANFWDHWDALNKFNYNSYDEFMEKITPEQRKSNLILFAFYEGLGVLVKRGLIEPSLIDDLMSAMVVSYWDKMRLFYMEYRVRANNPMAGEWIEYLYGVIKSIMVDQHPELSGKKLGL